MTAPMILTGLPISEIVPAFDATAGVPAGAVFSRGALFTRDGLLCIAPNGTPAVLNPDGLAFDSLGRLCTCTTGATVTSTSAPFAVDSAGRLLVSYGGAAVAGYWGGVPYTEAGALPVSPGVDFTAAALRAAMDDPASWGAGGWLIPGTAGARVSNNSRASLAWAQQQDGSWRPVRHNMIRNSVLSGAVTGVVGSGGALPTNFIFVAGTTGLSCDVAAVTTDSGFPATDVRLYGLAAATSSLSLRFDAATVVAAVAGQVWTHAVYLRQVGGTRTGITATSVGVVEATGGGSFVTNGSTGVVPDNTLQRYSHTRTLTGATTGNTQAGLFVSVVSGQNVDITIRIAQPELYLGPLRDGVMPTSGTALYGPAIDWRADIGDWVIRHEAQATNEVRNSAGVGAAAGTPGTDPTGWVITANGNGLTKSIAGTGIANGLPYVDVTFSGTPTAAIPCEILPMQNNNRSALSGQSWVGSHFLSVAPGSSLSGVASVSVSVAGINAALSAITESTSTGITGQLSTTMARYSAARTLSDAATAWVRTGIAIGVSVGVPVNVTLRVYSPQLEQSLIASSPIVTYGTAATRAIDTSSGTYTGTAEGAIIVDGGFFAATSTAVRAIAGLDDGTASNQIALLADVSGAAGDGGALNVDTAGAQQALVTNSADFTTALFRLSGTWNAADFRLFRDGVQVGTPGTSGTVPATTAFRLGHAPGGTNSMNGYIRRLRIANVANAANL